MSKTRGNSTHRSALAALPKIELHRHLEGSLRLSTLREIAIQYKLDLPTRSIEDLRPYVQVMNDEPNFRNFLEKFNVLRRFYQSPEIIRRLAFEVIEDAANDNVRYMELRVTPAALSKTKGYPLAEVTDWVLAAVAEASKKLPSIAVGLLISINRHESVEIAEKVTQIAVDRKGKGVVGLDLAGDEANFPAEPFAALFHQARAAGLGVVAHAGEWSGPETVRHAIEVLHAQRIGHGVRVVEDKDVAALARERSIGFEVCVTSNVQSGVVQKITDHPLRDMMYMKLRTTVNTDDPSVSNITLTDEYEAAVEELGVSLDDLKSAILTAADCAFLPPPERESLTAQFKLALGLEPLARAIDQDAKGRRR